MLGPKGGQMAGRLWDGDENVHHCYHRHVFSQFRAHCRSKGLRGYSPEENDVECVERCPSGSGQRSNQSSLFQAGTDSYSDQADVGGRSNSVLFSPLLTPASFPGIFPPESDGSGPDTSSTSTSDVHPRLFSPSPSPLLGLRSLDPADTGGASVQPSMTASPSVPPQAVPAETPLDLGPALALSMAATSHVAGNIPATESIPGSSQNPISVDNSPHLSFQPAYPTISDLSQHITLQTERFWRTAPVASQVSHGILRVIAPSVPAAATALIEFAKKRRLEEHYVYSPDEIGLPILSETIISPPEASFAELVRMRFLFSA